MLNQIKIWPISFMTWAQKKFFRKDDVGASLVEYALLLALIAVVAIASLAFLSGNVNNALTNVGHNINNSLQNAGTTTSSVPAG